MRIAIHSLIVDLYKAYKPCRIKGYYPPKLNLCKNQSEEELIGELRKMICYMKNPEYSYLRKDKKV